MPPPGRGRRGRPGRWRRPFRREAESEGENVPEDCGQATEGLDERRTGEERPGQEHGQRAFPRVQDEDEEARAHPSDAGHVGGANVAAA